MNCDSSKKYLCFVFAKYQRRADIKTTTAYGTPLVPFHLICSNYYVHKSGGKQGILCKLLADTLN